MTQDGSIMDTNTTIERLDLDLGTVWDGESEGQNKLNNLPNGARKGW